MDERERPAEQRDDRRGAGVEKAPAGQSRWGLVAAGFLVAGVLGFTLLQVLAPQPQQKPREVNAPLVQVQPLQMKTGPLPVRGNGPVRPRAQVTLMAQVTGEVVEVSSDLVTGGSFLKGETLARIDPRPYRAMLDQAEAERRARQADLAFAQRQLERDQKLQQSGAASERRRDQTLNQRDRARAQIAGLDALITTRVIDLERTVIIAPFNGRVFTEQVDVGSVIMPGNEIARVYATDLFEIVVPLSDREAALIPGLWDTDRKTTPAATATLPYRGRFYSWPGYVDRVEAGIDPDTRTIDVVVRIPNPTQRGTLIGGLAVDTLAEAPPMLTGTYASVEIEGVNLNYALIPRAALRNKDTIWIARDNGTLKVVPVDVLQDQGKRVAIRHKSFDTGDRLIVSDLAIVSEGLAVRIAEPESYTP